MNLTVLAVALLATVLVVDAMFPPTAIADDDPTKDTKVAAIILDLKTLYGALNTYPRNTVIEARNFDSALGSYLARRLRLRKVERIHINGNHYRIVLSQKVTESGEIVSTTLDREVSFNATGTAEKFSMHQIKGISAKPKTLLVGSAAVTTLDFTLDCVGNTVVAIKLSGMLFFRGRQLMIIAPDGSRLSTGADCR
jgi:hypothetical protein